MPHARRVPHRQPVTARGLRLAGAAAAERAAFGQQLRASRAVNRAVDAAAAEQRFVRGVDDGVDGESGDVGQEDFEVHSLDSQDTMGTDITRRF